MNLASDDFTIFGLEPRFVIDDAALDGRRRALLGEAHPDRHATQGAAAQRSAMQWSVRINEAYRRLKDPLQRAACLCELRGVPVDAERNTAMPSDFLMQQMAWREALDEATTPAAIQTLAREVEAHREASLASIGKSLDRDDDAAGAAAQVRALMFVERFAADIDRRLDTLGQ